MALFTTLAGAAVMTMLLRFLLCSRFTVPKAADWRQAACWCACWWLLCLNVHWAVQIGAAFLASAFLGWYIGRTRIPEALFFGVLFGILRFASLLCAFVLDRSLNGVDVVSMRIADLTVFYALGVCGAVVGSKWRDTPMPVLQLIPVWLVAVVLCEEIIRTGDAAVLAFFSLVWLLYAGISLIQVQKQIEARQRSYLEQQQKAYHYAMQEEYYQQLRSKQAETRALWHDLNKYLRAAKAETDSSRALEQLGAMLDSSMEIVDVGNPVLNVILNEYAMTAKAAGIELRMNVQVPEQLDIAAADLYVIIGNTMDNAIEACKTLPAQQRLIDLVLRTQHDIVFYQLANPCAPHAPKRRTDPLRGYGLQNVSRCAEQYDGSMESIEKDGYFMVTIHLNQNKVYAI